MAKKVAQCSCLRWRAAGLSSCGTLRKIVGIVSTGVAGAATAVLATALSTIPAFGAERISFFYPPFGEFSLSIDSLEVFAKSGKITREFRFYARRVNPEQLGELRSLLLERLPVTPTLVSQFTYSPVGEKVLQRLGALLQTDARLNGFYALRSSLILSAADSQQGLTILNALRKFPSYSIRLDLERSRQITKELSGLLRESGAIVAAITQLAAEAATASRVDFSKQLDLRLPGSLDWQQQTLNLNDRFRNRFLAVDLYLPRLGANAHPAPVIVISHGAAEDRTSFIYIAKHLASYGFAVAVIDHPGSDTKRFGQYFAGLAGPPEPVELLNQPMEIKYVLDQLQQLEKSTPALRGQLNLQQVGVIGHSLGGYAALTLAGATINPQLGRDCDRDQSLNISILVQCRAAELLPITASLQEERVKAVIAVNPVTSLILGESGLSQIKVPLMLVAGSADIVTPVVPEQVRPFTWLTTTDKYLALIENATHFSAVGELAPGHSVLPVPQALIGPNPAIARLYLSALSVAFFQTHVANRPEYRPYLSASYAKFITQAPLNLNLVQSFTANQLAEVLNQGRRSTVTSKDQLPTSSRSSIDSKL